MEREMLSLLLANMRVPHEREGDLLGQWSTNRIGEERMKALAREYGRGELLRRASELMEWTERLTRELLAGQMDLAVVADVETGNEIEQGRLARPGRPHDREELRRVDLEVDPPQRPNRSQFRFGRAGFRSARSDCFIAASPATKPPRASRIVRSSIAIGATTANDVSTMFRGETSPEASPKRPP